jgi:hypothetical protein
MAVNGLQFPHGIPYITADCLESIFGGLLTLTLLYLLGCGEDYGMMK